MCLDYCDTVTTAVVVILPMTFVFQIKIEKRPVHDVCVCTTYVLGLNTKKHGGIM